MPKGSGDSGGTGGALTAEKASKQRATSRRKARADRPRHGTLSAILGEEIRSGRYPVGARFTTEEELQKRFKVGRHTVRQALKTLADQGLLGRRRKLGTHVLSTHPFAHYAHTLRDLRGLFNFAGDTYLEVHRDGFVVPTEPIAGDAPSGERWLRIAGVRHMAQGDEPLCWAEIFVPSRFPLDREVIRHERRTIYEYCMEQHGLKLDYVQQEIRATILPAQIARLLSAEPDSSALLVTRRYLDDSGRVFEVSVNLYPSDRYSVRTIISPS